MINALTNRWFGCLRDAERECLQIVFDAYLFGLDYVPVAAYDVIWVLSGGESIDSPPYAQWVEFLALSVVLVPQPDGEPIAAYRFDFVAIGAVYAGLFGPPPKYLPCSVRPPYAN